MKQPAILAILALALVSCQSFDIPLPGGAGATVTSGHWLPADPGIPDARYGYLVEPTFTPEVLPIK